MNISNELLEKAKKAKSAEELLEMAKAENIELTAVEAAKAFAELHKSGELLDDELDNVAGGCSDDPESEEPKKPVNKFNVGDRVYITPRYYTATVQNFWTIGERYVYDVKYDDPPFRYDSGRPIEIASYEENRLELIK